jgi:hypothetical protein
MTGLWAQRQIVPEEQTHPPIAPSYDVDAAYEAANRRLFYKALGRTSAPYPGCSGGSQARGIARQVAGSFRARITSPLTAERDS